MGSAAVWARSLPDDVRNNPLSWPGRVADGVASSLCRLLPADANDPVNVKYSVLTATLLAYTAIPRLPRVVPPRRHHVLRPEGGGRRENALGRREVPWSVERHQRLWCNLHGFEGLRGVWRSVVPRALQGRYSDARAGRHCHSVDGLFLALG